MARKLMLARLAVLVAAVAAVAFGTIRGTWAAGGSDSSCYALMAEAFARGAMQPTTSLALDAPWPDASRTFAPGGFIPSPRRADAASPICSPGFSLLLAPLRAVGGRDAVFLLTPIAGGLLVWLTYVLGRQIVGELVGASAAVVVAAMPVFLFQVVQPMNDVLVAMLWTAVIVLAARLGGRSLGEGSPQPNTAAIGVVTGLAILVRPNLVGALIAVFAWVALQARQSDAPYRRGAAWRAPTMFMLSLAPFVIVTAALNYFLYGHVLASGYGNTGDLFSPAHIIPNVQHYGSALLGTQLGLPLVGLAAPFVLSRQQRPIAWVVVATAAIVALIYLLYTPYPEWWYLRFFLPVLPALTVLAISTIAVGTRSQSVAMLLAAGVTAFAMTSEATRQALDLQRLERRFRTTGEVVSQRLPENAVYVTVWESGTVKYHAGRDALLWDSLDPSWLDRAIEWLTSRGLEPLIILEQWEEPTFRQRFASHSEFGNVDWPPRFDIERQVRIFNPKDRVRYLAGESIPTEIIRTDRR